jgi:hypothetical protein
MLNVTLVPELFELAQRDPVFIRKSLEVNPQLIDFIKFKSFDELCFRGHAGLIHPKTIKDDVECPPLNCMVTAAMNGHVDVINVCLDLCAKSSKKHLLLWTMHKVFRVAITLNDLTLVEFLLTRAFVNDDVIEWGFLQSEEMASLFHKFGHRPTPRVELLLIHRCVYWRRFSTSKFAWVGHEYWMYPEMMTWRNLRELNEIFNSVGDHDVVTFLIDCILDQDRVGVHFMMDNFEYTTDDVGRVSELLFNCGDSWIREYVSKVLN